jgi:hypothetical protein
MFADCSGNIVQIDSTDVQFAKLPKNNNNHISYTMSTPRSSLKAIK